MLAQMIYEHLSCPRQFFPQDKGFIQQIVWVDPAVTRPAMGGGNDQNDIILEKILVFQVHMLDKLARNTK
jgi:hypothetical protein